MTGKRESEKGEGRGSREKSVWKESHAAISTVISSHTLDFPGAAPGAQCLQSFNFNIAHIPRVAFIPATIREGLARAGTIEAGKLATTDHSSELRPRNFSSPRYQFNVYQTVHVRNLTN